MESIMKIKHTLTYMLDAHQQLLGLAQQKRTILVEGNVPELQNVIIKENKCADLIRKLEEQREQLIRIFIKEKGLKSQTLTMDQFIGLVEENEEKKFLKTLTTQLRSIVLELSHLNQNNQELIKMAMSYVQYSINILMPKEPSIGYGMKPAARSAKLLDAKI